MIAGALLVYLTLAGPEPYLPRDFAAPGPRERDALVSCTRFWLDHVSPETAGGTCACYLRGLRQLAGRDEVPDAWLRNWPRRTQAASRAFRACFEHFLAADELRCARWGLRRGLGPGACCGSSGCLPDFAITVALDSGYILQETELEGAERLGRNRWTTQATHAFLAGCAGRGYGPRRCGCFLQVARIFFVEAAFNQDAEASTYEPPNAWDDLIDGCNRFHRAEAAGKRPKVPASEASAKLKGATK